MIRECNLKPIIIFRNQMIVISSIFFYFFFMIMQNAKEKTPYNQCGSVLENIYMDLSYLKKMRLGVSLTLLKEK